MVQNLFLIPLKKLFDICGYKIQDFNYSDEHFKIIRHLLKCDKKSKIRYTNQYCHNQLDSYEVDSGNELYQLMLENKEDIFDVGIENPYEKFKRY